MDTKFIAISVGSFAVGCATGAAVYHIIRGKQLEDKMYAELNEMIDEEKELLDDMIEKLENITPTEPEVCEDEDEPDEEDVLNADENYLKYAAAYEHPTDDGEVIADPYVISVTQFVDEHEEYDKISLTYLAGDDTLIDDSEEIMEIGGTIGRRTIPYFRNQVAETDMMTIYVRNDRSQADFEIAWSDASYGRDYLGIFE